MTSFTVTLFTLIFGWRFRNYFLEIRSHSFQQNMAIQKTIRMTLALIPQEYIAALKRLFVESSISKLKNIEVIYSGFDYPSVDSSKLDDFKRSSNQIFIAGRLVGFKGHRYAIEAIKKATAEIPDAHLYIAGWGPEEESLKKQTDELGLNDNVTFLGYQNNILEWMAASDVILVPSISEGFGLVILEAFNAQSPIIAFDVPACNELIIDNQNGFLIPAYDTDIMAKKIVEVLKNPAESNHLVQAGNEKLKSYYTLNRMAKDIHSFYQKVL